MIAASATNLSFPITITCTFDETPGQNLTAGVISIEVLSVTENGQSGNPASLSVGVGVS